MTMHEKVHATIEDLWAAIARFAIARSRRGNAPGSPRDAGPVDRAATVPARTVAMPASLEMARYRALVAQVEQLTLLRRSLTIGTPEFEANCAVEKFVRGLLNETSQQRKAYLWTRAVREARRGRGQCTLAPAQDPFDIA